MPRKAVFRGKKWNFCSATTINIILSNTHASLRFWLNCLLTWLISIASGLELIPLFVCCSYVCHAEVNAILNTNHASAAGQVTNCLISYYIQFVYPTLNTHKQTLLPLYGLTSIKDILLFWNKYRCVNIVCNCWYYFLSFLVILL